MSASSKSAVELHADRVAREEEALHRALDERDFFTARRAIDNLEALRPVKPESGWIDVDEDAVRVLHETLWNHNPEHPQRHTRKVTRVRVAAVAEALDLEPIKLTGEQRHNLWKAVADLVVALGHPMPNATDWPRFEEAQAKIIAVFQRKRPKPADEFAGYGDDDIPF